MFKQNSNRLEGIWGYLQRFSAHLLPRTKEYHILLLYVEIKEKKVHLLVWDSGLRWSGKFGYGSRQMDCLDNLLGITQTALFCLLLLLCVSCGWFTSVDLLFTRLYAHFGSSVTHNKDSVVILFLFSSSSFLLFRRFVCAWHCVTPCVC